MAEHDPSSAATTGEPAGRRGAAPDDVRARAGSSHGLGALFGYDVVHGLRTILPVPIALAGPKHFVAYGAAVGGRDDEEVDVSDAALHDVYLPPFATAVEAGAADVMTAHTDVNGVPATGNALLLGEVLRGGLGFEGFTVSDADAVRSLVERGFARDRPDAAARAIGVGVDVAMAFAEPACAHLADLVGSGVVDGALLETSARRVVEATLRLGLDRDPTVDVGAAEEVLSDPVHRGVARTAAARSAVLLRNEGAVLPLDASSAGSIAVLGPLADDARAMLGPWCFAFDLDETVTVLDGITARTGGSDVRHAPGVRPAQRPTESIFDRFPGNRPTDPEGFDDAAEPARAVDVAAASEVAVVVGEWQDQVGEQVPLDDSVTVTAG